MTCERYEAHIALFVEGDLREGDIAPLERHLATCRRCRTFRRGLETSQSLLRSLADEPLPAPALSSLRARVLAAASRSACAPWAMPAWGWGLAACAALAVVALAYGGRVVAPRRAPATATVVPSPPPAPQTGVSPATSSLPGPRRTAVSPAGSTPTRAVAVSHGVGSETTGNLEPLSLDDADRLARAVVEISRLDSLRDSWQAPAASDEPKSQVVRLETDDPDVVIYWQMDPNGG